MNDRELAKDVVTKVFNIDLKGDIGRMARFGVTKEEKRDIVNRVHRLITTIRQETVREIERT